MTPATLLQAWIFATGIAAVLALQFGGAKARSWAPVVGLAGQPAWLWYAWQGEALGVGLVSLAYTAVWAAGCVHAWQRRGGAADDDDGADDGGVVVGQVCEWTESEETSRLARAIADQEARYRVECESTEERLGNLLWWDTRTTPDDEDPNAADAIVELDACVRYLELRDHIVRHPTQPYRVRFVAASALPPSGAPA